MNWPDKVDTILILQDEEDLNEAMTVKNGRDTRMGVTQKFSGSYSPSVYTEPISPSSQMAFGGALRGGLSLGPGYGVNVVDFGTDVGVHVTYTNIQTGKSGGMYFIIHFSSKKGTGYVKANATKWRTIADVNQAIAYIRSRCTILPSMCQST